VARSAAALDPEADDKVCTKREENNIVATVNITANRGVDLGVAVGEGLIHVHCLGSAPTTFGRTTVNRPPPNVSQQITAGDMLALQVDLYAACGYGNEHCTIRLLYSQGGEKEAINEIEGAAAISQRN
jgi:hypothetical protein